MKQKMAIGASWMTRPISFIATSNTPSIAVLSTCVCGVWTSISPMPKKSAKNITASTSFWLIALKQLLGTMATTASTPDFDSCARSEEHTSELQVTNAHLVCRLQLEKKKKKQTHY